MQQITITVGKSGDTTVAAKGIKGQSCEEITKSLEKNLGVTESRKRTSEYYEAEEAVQGEQKQYNES